MSKIDELTLGDIKDLRSMFIGSELSCKSLYPNGAIKIVIAQRGWVFVGKVYLEGDEYVIKNSSVIIRWGTKKGLGQLAKEGPLENTNLGEKSTTRIHKLSVVAMIDCDRDKWRDHV